MAKGRLYTVEFHAVSIAAVQDLFMLAPATNKPLAIAGFNLANVGITADAGDAQEEDLSLRIIRGFATVGSGGSAGTSQGVDALNTAAATTARINDTTVAVVGGGTTQSLWSDGWNTRSPYILPVTDEQEFSCSAGDTRILLRLDSTPNDAFLCNGTLWYRELL